MRILVVGAGAVGGYFGGRLVEAGRDVTFLVRGRRAEGIESKGLQVLSPHGNLTLHPNAVTTQQITGSYDLILLGVKTYALSGAMDDFASAVGSDTTILGAINCLLRGNIGQINAIPGGSGLCLSILCECVDIAKACGYSQSSGFLERQTADLTAQGSPMTSSMYRDLRKGLPVEVDTILGDLFHRGRQYELKTPLLEAAFVGLSIYQQERGRAVRV